MAGDSELNFLEKCPLIMGNRENRIKRIEG